MRLMLEYEGEVDSYGWLEKEEATRVEETLKKLFESFGCVTFQIAEDESEVKRYAVGVPPNKRLYQGYLDLKLAALPELLEKFGNLEFTAEEGKYAILIHDGK